MKLSKPLLTAGILASISVTGVGAGAVSAQTATTDSGSSIVSKLAQKFNLKTEEVQQVFDEDRQAKETERDAEVEKTLSQAVTDNKLTSAQKDAITAKRKALETEREADRSAMDSKTDAERKTAMEAKRTELETWAKEDNIPTEYTKYVMGGGRGGHHGPDGPGERDKSAEASSTETAQ